MSNGPVVEADTIDELLRFDEDDPQLISALGPVHRPEGKLRWMVVLNQFDLPDLPSDITYGDFLYNNINPASAAASARLITVTGWMFTSVSWYVEEPGPGWEGRIREHPDRQHSAIALYIDQATGAISSRVTTKTEVFTKTDPYPAGGWDTDEHGTVPALLGKLRSAAMPPNPLLRNPSRGQKAADRG